MKNTILLTLFVLLLLPISMVSSQNSNWSKWSITAEYGLNQFDGDITQSSMEFIPTSSKEITFGGSIEYNFTPIWGLSLNYYNFPLRAEHVQKNVRMETNLQSTDLNATMNITRLVFPQSKSKFYLGASVGIGMAYYTLNPTTITDEVRVTPTIPAGTQIGDVGKTGIAGCIPVTFTVEYNFSKPLALGLRAHYRAHTKDNLEGTSGAPFTLISGSTNDYIAAGTLYLRYKINGIKKPHLRNINMNQFAPEEGLVLARQLQRELASMKGKVDTITDRVNNIALKVTDVEKRMGNMENLMSNNGNDEDADGVPDQRDLEPQTPTNTIVDFWGRTIILKTTTNSSTGSGSGSGSGTTDMTNIITSVYFGFDKTNLDNSSLIVIKNVAKKMKEDSTLLLEVRGYCDYIGNTAYNNALSKRRAERVKEELVKIWGISPERINANGNGKVIEPRKTYITNRRCDFFFNK